MTLDPREATIEVSIPMLLMNSDSSASSASSSSGGDPECAICCNAMCPTDACKGTSTLLTCCGQPMCCGCLYKVLKRCRCVEGCKAVIGMCPFCREMCRADAISIFLGHQRMCAWCDAASNA